MALSDHEQHALERIELIFHVEDPAFAARFSRFGFGDNAFGRRLGCVALFITGLAATVIAVALAREPVVSVIAGVLGYLAMFAAVLTVLPRRPSRGP